MRFCFLRRLLLTPPPRGASSPRSSRRKNRDKEDHVTVIRDFRSKIESEISNICDSILKLLNSHLIPSASSGDSKVFYLKIKGDYHRFQHQVSNIRLKVGEGGPAMRGTRGGVGGENRVEEGSTLHCVYFSV
ncbi:hypothetical protein VIGAN_09107100 [Vigna angularis var. angularis]|uniref:14-3-3 domain-containing protein n=1 Tax=Vigna angularis var. angularis TaxID=157739 RepID=A0A0S3SY57_PHAAN|nr:hypothetical protein VIGAN_09107100 [Vigna angularis var. angularis]